MTASILRRLDRLEAMDGHRRPVLIAVENAAQAQAIRDRQRGPNRLPFDPLVIITGIPRNPGDPLPDAANLPESRP